RVPDAPDRRRDIAAEPRALDRARRSGFEESRRPRQHRLFGGREPLSHHRDHQPRRMDRRGAARARRPAFHAGARGPARPRRAPARAAVALVPPARRIMLVPTLPNVLGPVIVATTLSVGGIILAESVLSYLGLGIQPPIASWGNMLSNAQELLTQAPQLVIYPGLAIMMTVIAFNFLGDGLQDALDPR